MKWGITIGTMTLAVLVGLLGMIVWDILYETPHLAELTALRQEISQLDQETIRALQEASQWDQETINIQQETIQIYQRMLRSPVGSK